MNGENIPVKRKKYGTFRHKTNKYQGIPEK
jgi:hypothetical protein